MPNDKLSELINAFLGMDDEALATSFVHHLEHSLAKDQYSATDHIGDAWVTDLDRLQNLEPFANDPDFCAQWRQIKTNNKAHFARYIRHWLFRIANNVARDAGRRNTARLKRIITDDEYIHNAVSTTTRPDTAAVQSDLLTRVEAALSELPDKQREAFLLRVHSGMRFRELAEYLNEPISTVTSQMRYAVTKLKPILKPIIQDES